MHFSELAHLDDSGQLFASDAYRRPENALEAAKSASAEMSDVAEIGALVDAPFLVFRLGDSVFGVPALAVRTIQALPALSPLPETSPFVAGVFNLRGAIVPVIDLNARFGHQSPPYRLDDSLIVLSWDGAEVAIAVNEVRAVRRISPQQMEGVPVHSLRHDLPKPFVAGMAQIDSDIVMLLHLPNLLHGAAPQTPTLAAGETAARRFEVQEWTPDERAILQQRAARLRQSEEAHSADAQSRAEGVPVAVLLLGGEEFGIELDVVREFVAVNAVAPVPCCPPHILGQINLRGDIVTLVDVRQTLRTSQTTPEFFDSTRNASTQNSRQKAVPVVVVQHEDTPVGIVVDELHGVLYLHEDERRVLDVNTQSGGTKYFAGGTLHEGRLLPLLDINKLFDEGGLVVEQSV